jgi:hypothetical protein
MHCFYVPGATRWHGLTFKVMKIVLLVTIIFVGCSHQLKQENYILIKEPASNSIIKKIIYEEKIKGYINKEPDGRFTEVGVRFDTPIGSGFYLDTIYFLYFDGDIIKCLAQSNYEKGLIYFEGNQKGECNTFYEFGGYVKEVSNIRVDEKRNSTKLTFHYTSIGTFYSGYKGDCVFESDNKTIQFKQYFKEDNDYEQWLESLR